MFIDVLIFGIIIGKLRGGKIKALENLHLRYVYLFFIGLLLQIIPTILFLNGNSILKDLGPLLHIFSYVFIFIGIYFNYKVPGIPFMGLGALLNFVIILANGGRMPVALYKLEALGKMEDIHLLKLGKVPMYIVSKNDFISRLLGDVLSVSPLFRSQVFSIGDVLMAIGIFIFIQQGMVYRCTKDAKRKSI